MVEFIHIMIINNKQLKWNIKQDCLDHYFPVNYFLCILCYRNSNMLQIFGFGLNIIFKPK